MTNLYTGDIAETLQESREHTVRFPFGQVVYWENGTAAHNGDNWTAIHIQRRHFPRVEFDLKDFQNRQQMARMVIDTLRLLHAAYEQGAKDKAAQVRDVLGCAKDNSSGPGR